MSQQLEADALSQVVHDEQEEELTKLKAELEAAQAKANVNKQAMAVLEELRVKGVIQQNEDGSIVPVHSPNVIRNQNDEMD